MKILIVKPSSLGDVVHTFPAVALLRQEYPDATISWLVNDDLSGLVELVPAVDDVIPFRRRRWGKPWLAHELFGHLWHLRRSAYDVAVDFQGLFRSGFVTLCSGASRRIGFSQAREGAALFYSERITVPANLKHAVDKNLFLVQQAFGISRTAPAPELLRRQETVKAIDTLWTQRGLNRAEPVLAVAPVTRWPSKTWPPEYFASIIDATGREFPHLGCWLVGTRAERAAGEAVVAACQLLKPHNLMGETDMSQLLEMLRRSDVLLTNDSGPMHLAAAAHRPAVALFGPTDPALTGPYGPGHVVFHGHCDQGPCFRPSCRRERRHCVCSVAPDAVAAAVIERFRALGSPGRREKTAVI